ncbi:glycosyltransferase [Arthrobacter crusticola]|uniref:Glycosyltransferase n=1 Tax=Arthrobacter crusticola TaxID=2547960 RepID=A0A4R5U264_9MICC|nr:glycosyltransferase [Arthrobacter crusticola]TDK27731.1 glycosyltransferase [Arthrobacter crusticola]
MTVEAYRGVESTSRAKRSILLYGDVDLNIIDGSAIWLASMAEALSMTNSSVTVLLKAQVTNSRLSKKIEELPGVTVLKHFEDISRPHDIKQALHPRLAAQILVGIDEASPFDLIIARGRSIVIHLANSGKLNGRLWPYMTDIPDKEGAWSDELRAQLARVMGSSRRVFAQTEQSRGYLESAIPAASGKVVLLPPMIPDALFAGGKETSRVDSSGPLRLVYSGKFARDWRTLEMCDVPAKLAERGVETSLTLIGDKFQDDPKDPKWAPAMRAAASDSAGVNWLGGHAREQALEMVAGHHIGLSWRTAALDESLELSTKLLEYAALGVPPLINRTKAHEEIFGEQYPLFVEDNLLEVLESVSADRSQLLAAGKAAREAVREYSISRAAQRLEQSFARSEPNYATTARSQTVTRVVLAGHDLKFAGELIDALAAREDLELRIDKWSTLHTHDGATSEALLEWADVVICEWAGPNAVYYSQRVRPEQKLLVRLHMFELSGPWLKDIDFDTVDTVVCVSDLYRDVTIERTGCAPNKVVVIANGIDAADLSRPKVEGSRSRIGIVGIVPIRKRPDRALDLLERLSAKNPDTTLHIKGRMPWEYPWEWKKVPQRELYREFFSRIGSTPGLRDKVVFEPFGADMGNWLRKIGFILSPSSSESFHLAPAEGMASGAVPVFWRRPGVEEIFGEEFVHESTDAAAEHVWALMDNPSAYELASQSAREFARRFDSPNVASSWLSLVLSGSAGPSAEHVGRFAVTGQ